MNGMMVTGAYGKAQTRAKLTPLRGRKGEKRMEHKCSDNCFLCKIAKQQALIDELMGVLLNTSQCVEHCMMCSAMLTEIEEALAKASNPEG